MSKRIIAGLGVVAGLAVALAPVATFAAEAANASDSHTEEMVITVQPSCTFGDWTQIATPLPGGITHSTGAWNTSATSSVDSHTDDDVASTGYGIIAGEGGNVAADAEAEPPVVGNLNASEHTVTQTMQAGTINNTFASTTMKIVCTNTEGYTLKVATPSLTNETVGYTDKTIPAGAYTTSQSGYNLASITANNGAEDEETHENASDVIVSATNYYNGNSATAIVKHTGISASAGDTIDVVYGVGIQGNQAAGTYSGKVVYTLFQGKN